MEAYLAKARAQAAVAVSLMRAVGGWKYREHIPMPDEEVKRLGELAYPAVQAQLVRLAIAERVLDELGRGDYYRQRLAEVGLDKVAEG